MRRRNIARELYRLTNAFMEETHNQNLLQMARNTVAEDIRQIEDMMIGYIDKRKEECPALLDIL